MNHFGKKKIKLLEKCYLLDPNLHIKKASGGPTLNLVTAVTIVTLKPYQYLVTRHSSVALVTRIIFLTQKCVA